MVRKDLWKADWFLGVVVALVVLITTQLMWIPLMTAYVLLVLGHLAWTTRPQLMFKIANERPIDPLSLNPALLDCVVAIMHKALARNKDERYHTGEEMRRAIRECVTELSAVDMSL